MPICDIFRQIKCGINCLSILIINDSKYSKPDHRERMNTRMETNEIFKAIAAEDGVSVKKIKSEIQKALDLGYESPSEEVRDAWNKIPSKRKKPTIEEVLKYILNELKLDA